MNSIYEMTEYKNSYRHRKWRQIQLVNAKRFDVVTPYTREDFFGWLDSSEYDELLVACFEDGARHLLPTIDRIDSARGYVLDNMRVITHRANSAKGARPIKIVSAADVFRRRTCFLGEIVMMLRQSLGLTQTQLADAVGKGKQSISQCETRETDFAIKLLVELWKRSSFTADEFLGMLDKLPWPPPKPGPKRKARIRQGVK
jgi:hypothetical protein